MKNKDIDKFMHAINDALDFITTNTDSDINGLREEMVPPLQDLMSWLKLEANKNYNRSLDRLVKKKLIALTKK